MIQYAAAGVIEPRWLWNTGSPARAGDDSGGELGSAMKVGCRHSEARVKRASYDAQLRSGESKPPIVVMDSGLALRAPRNDNRDCGWC